MLVILLLMLMLFVFLMLLMLVVVGDASFVSNGALALRGNANRDVFLNSLAWLSGLDALTASRAPGNVVTTGLDSSGWLRFGLLAASGPSVLVLLAGCLVFVYRRWRS